MSVEETARARDLRVRREVRSRLADEISHLSAHGLRGVRFCQRWPDADQPVVRDELLKQIARLIRFSGGGA